MNGIGTACRRCKGFQTYLNQSFSGNTDLGRSIRFQFRDNGKGALFGIQVLGKVERPTAYLRPFAGGGFSEPRQATRKRVVEQPGRTQTECTVQPGYG